MEAFQLKSIEVTAPELAALTFHSRFTILVASVTALEGGEETINDKVLEVPVFVIDKGV